jgi:hypothetical protein
VEHTCHQCGAAIEEGLIFCPKCNAPQIRVTLPEPSAPLMNAAAPPLHVPSLPLANRIQWSEALPAVGGAVLLAAVLTLITVGSLGLGMLVAGALAVVFYRRSHPYLNLTAGLGARLGAFTGAVGFILGLVALAVAVLGFHAGPKFHDAVLKAIEQYVARNPAPQSQQVIEMFKTSDGFALMVTGGLIFVLLACVAFSTAGGALTALLFRRKNRL